FRNFLIFVDTTPEIANYELENTTYTDVISLNISSIHRKFNGKGTFPIVLYFRNRYLLTPLSQIPISNSAYITFLETGTISFVTNNIFAIHQTFNVTVKYTTEEPLDESLKPFVKCKLGSEFVETYFDGTEYTCTVQS